MGKGFQTILLLAELVFFSSHSYTQWFWQNPLPQGNPLQSVKFVSPTVGWAVGNVGTILRTTNGGSTWTQQSSGTVRYLVSVSFTDSNNGTAVGGNGTILRTTNGGTTWTQQSSGTTNNLLGISFVNSYNGTAVGMNGTILRTTNGGNTWTQQSSGTTNQLDGVSFTDSVNGSVVGEAGTILRTTNGGNTWTQQSSGITNLLEGVSFTDSNNGTAVGDYGIILRTTNGGTTWTQQSSGTTNHLIGVSFTDSYEGTAVGWNGTILRTNNGGGILPVELISFTAIVSGNEVLLNWSTATETNNHGFEIQRSKNKTDWLTIGYKEGNGTTTEKHNYFYADNISSLNVGEIYYRLKQEDFNGRFKYSNVVELELAAAKFELSQNYPNPFNPTTKISWQLPVGSWQTLKVYDVLGREAATLVNEYKPAGKYEVEFDGSNLPSGIYFYKLSSGDYNEVKKMLLLK